jgi:hypothetical protein
VGLAHDLLQQANHLATYEGANPSQASLRRAVSTAYYALFHLLIEDGRAMAGFSGGAHRSGTSVATWVNGEHFQEVSERDPGGLAW